MANVTLKFANGSPISGKLVITDYGELHLIKKSNISKKAKVTAETMADNPGETVGAIFSIAGGMVMKTINPDYKPRRVPALFKSIEENIDKSHTLVFKTKLKYFPNITLEGSIIHLDSRNSIHFFNEFLSEYWYKKIINVQKRYLQ